MIVRDLVQTCGSFPSQWEARTVEDDRPVYIRYRWGNLTVTLGDPAADMDSALDRWLLDEHWFEGDEGDEFAGDMATSTMLQLTGIVEESAP